MKVFLLPRRGLGADLAASLAVHVLIAAVLFLVLTPRPMRPGQTLLAAGLSQKASQDGVEPPRKEELHTQASLAQATIESELAQVVSGELAPQDEEKLLKDMQDTIQSDVAKLGNSVVPGSALQPLSDRLRKKVYADLASELENMARRMIQAEVDAQLDSGVYDQIKNKIEAGSAAAMGGEIAEAIRKQSVQSGQRKTGPEDLNGILPRLQKEVADGLQKQSLDDLNEGVANRLTQALIPEAVKMKMSGDELHAIVAAEVKDHLALELQGHLPATKGIFTAGRVDNHLVGLDELRRALAAADEAVNTLAEARQSENNVAAADPAQPLEQVIAEQLAATGKYHTAHQSVEKARELASSLSEEDQTQVFAIGDRDGVAGTETSLNQIPELVAAQQRQPADALKARVIQAIDERSAQVRQLRDSLSREIDTFASTPAAPAAGPVDPGLEAQLEADVSQIASRHFPGILKSAGNIVAGDTSSTDMRIAGVAGLLGKLDQLGADLEEGRPAPGFGNDDLSGAGLPGYGAFPGGVSSFAFINADAMEKFGKDLRYRSDPANFYKPATDAEGIASVARPAEATEQPAEIYLVPGAQPPSTPPAQSPSLPAKEREIPNPKFKTVAFGAAAMMDNPITIDGDLSDWGELKHPIVTRYRSDGIPTADPTNVYVRWSPDGLFIAYSLKRQGSLIPNAYLGDCLEIWIDGQNVRAKKMSDSQTSQQLFLAPFGYQGDPRPAIVEVGRGNRGLRMFEGYVDRAGTLGRVAGKATADGYSVEAFISRKAIAYPNLVPGAYLAFNFSVNHGPAEINQEQWSAPKSQLTWDKPDTWGDLLLLGSDAKARFISYDDNAKPSEPLVVGRPIAFEIQDKDMDLNPHKRDRISAVLRTDGSQDGLFVVLEETADNSGVFRGSVNTQAPEEPPRPNTLDIRGGEVVQLIYRDLRTEYGETDRVVTITLPVGVPVLSLAAHP